MQAYNRVFIRDLSLYMFIGISEAEQAIKQAVVINIEADVSWPDDLNDDYTKVVCYAGICQWIREHTQKPVKLVETLAEDIADHVLSLTGVGAVRVRVEKPNILPDAVVGVDIYRRN